MCVWDEVFPAYGLASHKGYSTPEHWKALREFGYPLEAAWFARMVPTRDIQEGVWSWLQKRKPEFTGA